MITVAATSFGLTLGSIALVLSAFAWREARLARLEAKHVKPFSERIVLLARERAERLGLL